MKNYLITAVMFLVGAMILTDLVLFDFFRISRQNMSFGLLLLIQIIIAFFMAFIYFSVVKKK